MSYIYKITNLKNGKNYVGKTNLTVEKRFKEHIQDSKKERYEKRPLYSAMNKYGIENFSIEQLEECSENEVSEREKYWIEFLGSFKDGYNATVGGDGKQYIDYNLVVSTYKELKSITETSKKLNISYDSVQNILNLKKEKIFSQQEVNILKNGNIVNQYDLNGNYIKTFRSVSEAALSLNDKRKGTHISDVCKGKRKTAYGYIWKYADK